jgi:hypothetical protein
VIHFAFLLVRNSAGSQTSSEVPICSLFLGGKRAFRDPGRAAQDYFVHHTYNTAVCSPDTEMVDSHPFIFRETRQRAASGERYGDSLKERSLQLLISPHPVKKRKMSPSFRICLYTQRSSTVTGSFLYYHRDQKELPDL